MFEKVEKWYKKHTEYQLTEVEESLVKVIEEIINDPETEIHTLVDRPYFIKFKHGVCAVSDASIKLYWDNKIVFHDITPGMAYTVKHLIRNKVNSIIDDLEKDLTGNILKFIKEL